jgi:hypothetical protein
VLAIFLGQGQAADTRGSAPGSKWCAVNAIAEHADYGRRYTRAQQPGAAQLRGHAN